MVGHGFRLLEGNYVGGASVECVFSAGVEGIPSDQLRLYFLTEGRKVGVGSTCGREDVWNYTVQMYLYIRPQLKKGHFIQWETWLGACTPACSSFWCAPCFHAHISQHVLCIFFFGDSIVIPHLLLLGGRSQSQTFPGTRWYSCDTWEWLSNTASCCHHWHANRPQSDAGWHVSSRGCVIVSSSI